MNKNPKDNEKNMERKPYLFNKEYVDKFSSIFSEAESIIKSNDYEKVDFYGIIFCYLNYYEPGKFISFLNIYIKENQKDLFEILLIYSAHFKNPIEKSLDFFDEFIKYTLSKKDDNLEEDSSQKKDIISIKSKKDTTSKKDTISKKDCDFQIALSYIHDIETIIEIINKNKEEIYKKYKNGELKTIFVLDQKLKLKQIDEEKEIIQQPEPKDSYKGKEGNSISIQMGQVSTEDKIVSEAKKQNKKKKNSEILKIIKEIKEIIEYSNKNGAFLIHFTNEFWKYILNIYNKPILDNIKICSKLRDAFNEYFKLVEKIFEKTKEKDSLLIKKEANNYYQTDEFAFLIDQIMKKVLKDENQDLNNIQKLSYITTYNPYYKIEKKKGNEKEKEKKNRYSEKADVCIFDLFKLNDIEDDEKFIDDFRDMNFELIFRNNISEYIDKIISKIKTISNFYNIIKLINLKNIEDLGKIDIYLNFLNKKYENSIRNEINLLKGVELKKAIKVVANIAVINYKCEKIKEKKSKSEKDKKKEKSKDEKNKEKKEKKQFEFIEKRIKKLDKKIPLIFIEIMKICINYEEKNEKEKEEESLDNGDKSSDGSDKENNIDKAFDEDDDGIDYKEMEKYIFNQFVNKLDEDEDITNIINLIFCLEGKDTEGSVQNHSLRMEDNKGKGKENNENKRLNEFLKLLITKNLFKKDEFFSSNKNLKVDLLCKLNEKGIIKKNNEPYYDNILTLVKDIRDDLENKIQKEKIDDFLKNTDDIIKLRLNLIKIEINNYSPEDALKEIKKKIDKINESLKYLKYIKDNIIIYFKDSQKDLIKRLKDTIDNSKNMKIKFEGGDIDKLVKEIENLKLKDYADKINDVKNFLLFDELYSMTNGENFDDAYNKLKGI